MLWVINARYILSFYISYILNRLLNEGGVFWNNEKNQLYWKDTQEVMAQLEQRYYQNVIFFREPGADANTNDEASGEPRAEDLSKADAAFPVYSRKAKPV